MNGFLYVLIYLLTYNLPDTEEVDSMFTKIRISIDGNLNEWSNLPSTTIHDRRGRTNNSLSLQSVWNRRFLYLAFKVEDADLQAKQTVEDHAELFLDDMVEFLIDSRNDKDSCWDEDDLIYHINLLAQKKDDRGGRDCKSNAKWNGKATFAVKLFGTLNDSSDVDKGYNVEVAIPWKEIGKQPRKGITMGFNFANGDRGKLFDWAGASPFRSPYKFGNLKLTK